MGRTMGLFAVVTLQFVMLWGSRAIASTVTLKPGENVAAAVANAPAGSTFVFTPGTYRMQSIIPKDNDIFVGQSSTGVILNGAKVLTMEPNGKYWTKIEPLNPTVYVANHCNPGHARCYILNDLFIDGKLQRPVSSLSSLAAGHWYYNLTTGTIYISTNPAGHVVEWAYTTYAFRGAATGVQISFLTVKNYATPPQAGAIGGPNGKAEHWYIHNVNVMHNHGAGIAIGNYSKVMYCNSSSNGQEGLAGHGAYITIEHNTFAYNNQASYMNFWEAGGAKVTDTSHLLLGYNYVHDNLGTGLWEDMYNTDSVVENNTSINNLVGIAEEFASNLTLRNNVVRGNRKMGILISLSRYAEVYGNTAEVPVNGIDAIRVAEGQRDGMNTHDVHVHDNIMIFDGTKSGRTGLSGNLDTATNVTFNNDKYYKKNGGYYHWLWGGSTWISFTAMQKAGQELTGTVSTGAP
ncbi:right-handed parallel beta-helix repeat-containing protein [Candidatus Korobacter versatilis]|nr:right-handed parallel beta-helix repeat-containing protein [Candidatus Koribacter versatilis]